MFLTPDFARLLSPDQLLTGDVELDWLEQALSGQTIAAVWTGSQSLVAPLSYQRFESLAAVSERFASSGWPVRSRRSGGGVVPQGPGILNLSLAYPCDGLAGEQSQPVYRHLCSVLADALQTLGIASEPLAVQGSFCDGRYNLAVWVDGVARKICGTAQYWRRAGGAQAVLAHALVLLDARATQMTEQCNAFEAALGSDRRYLSDALTDVTQAWRVAHPGQPTPDDLAQQLTQQLLVRLRASGERVFQD
ncbi:MAG: lipoate--protein ligase [Rhodoferax sp.]|nr:lipoate--protein ligase [Rhodoferax sp.]